MAGWMILAGLGRAYGAAPEPAQTAPVGAARKAPEAPATQLDTVVVTGTRTERKIANVPGTTSVIDAETIERRLHRTIRDLVRYEPGVDVPIDPLRFGAAGFTIRGIGGNRVQMMVDGVRIPDRFSIGTFSNAQRNLVDVDALKAVEIVRGPGSSLYGSDALGGVVAFATKDPRDYLDVFGKNRYQSLKLLYGSAADQFLQTATLAGEAKGLEGLLLMTHAAGHELENQGTNRSFGSVRTAPNPQDTRALNLLAKLLYHFNADNRLRLTGEAFENETHTQVAHLYGEQYHSRETYKLETHDRQARWRVSLDQAIKNIGWGWLDTLNWQIYGQVNQTRQRADDRSMPQLQPSGLRLDIGDGLDQYRDRRFLYDSDMVGGLLQAGTVFAWGPSAHRLTYGAEAFLTHTDAMRDGNFTVLLGGPRSTTGFRSKFILPDTFPLRDFPLTDILRAGAFVQDEIALWNRRIELLPGVRFDYFGLHTDIDELYAKENKGNPINQQDVTAWSPRIGTLFHLNQALTLHGQYVEGFRAPNFSDSNSGFINSSFGYAVIPNVNLTPETSTGGEVGLRANTAFGSFDATFFRNDYQDFMQGVACTAPRAGEGACTIPPHILEQGLGLLMQTVNTPEPVRIQGFEFKGDLRFGRFWPALDGLSLLGAYAYAEGRNLGTDEPINQVSPMKGVLGLRYDAPSARWGTEAILTLQAGKRDEDIDLTAPQSTAVVSTAGYGMVDLLAYYRHGEHLTFNVGVFNLLDKKYSEWQALLTRGADPHAGLTPQTPVDVRDRYTQPGRNVSVSLRLEF
jgi:hemoglobin/transferrin/lactoferrin receptor protein